MAARNFRILAKMIFLMDDTELVWHSGCVMECHAMAQGLIPGNGVKIELHILRKGQ